MKTKNFVLVLMLISMIFMSFSSVSAADYNVNSLTDISGINSWLASANNGDTLFFNLNPSDIVTTLNNIIIDVSINIISTTGTVIQGTTSNSLFTITANNVNISGLTINGFNEGIRVDRGNNTHINNNSFNSNTGSIAIYNSNGSKVSNNTIKNNGGNNGIGIGNSNYTKVENNTIENSVGSGIATWDSHDNEITKNKIDTVNNGEGIYAKGNNHVIENNEITKANNGIYVDGDYYNRSSNVKVSNNKVSKNKYQGIAIKYTSSSKIANNQATYNNHNGIDLSYADNVQIINNTCNFNGNTSYYTNINSNNGIYLSYANNTIINDNLCDGNLRNGITLASSENTAVAELFNNICRNNGENGIYLGPYWGMYQTNFTTSVYNNTIYSNNHSGIANSMKSNIYNNIIYGNNLSGIYNIGISNINNNKISNNYEGITLAGSGSKIVKNTLINNTIGLKLNNYISPYLDQNQTNIANTTNNIFEYNRIVNSTFNLKMEYLNTTYYNTSADIYNNTGNFNWWGLNNPEDSIFQNSSAFNVSYWFVTNLTSMQDSINKGDSAKFNYTISLNDPTVSADPMNLPYFTFKVDGKTYDARKNQLLSKVYNEAGDQTFDFFVDNQLLEANVNVIDIPGPNPTPNNTTNNTNNTNHTNNTNNNPAVNAAMKETGIPTIILLVLLSSLGIIVRKK